MARLNRLKNDLGKLTNPKQAKILRGFFKTGPGQYGKGDIFLGLRAREIKDVVKKYFDLGRKDVESLLRSKIHEHRMAALRIMIYQYEQGANAEIFKLYLKNARRINNWDLVDCSAPNIVGDYLLTRPREILYQLAKSKNLWEKRIAILATFAFIRNHDFTDTLRIAKLLINDKHDLIHKALGWMLREVGNRNQKIEENFLKQCYQRMPRTMLRYAIEKFPENRRKKYLNGEI